MSNNQENRYENLISKSECCEIVAKALGDVNILKYKVSPLANGVVGFLGEYLQLFVFYSEKNKVTKDVLTTSFFVKSLPLANELQRKEITALGFMKKEILIYKTLFKDMEKCSTFRWHPEMYLARDDILVLEDLIQSNFKHMSFNYNSSPEYVRLGLECTAAMHACSIVYEVKNNVEIDKRYANCIHEMSLRRDNSWIAAGLKAICYTARIHSNLQSKEHQDFIRNRLPAQLETIFNLQDSFKHYRNTLCHRDLWEKNILYSNSTEQLQSVFVDFQLACYCPPGIDVLFFIYLNTSRANRKDHSDSYRRYYYDCLSKFAKEYDVNIEEQISWDEFEATINTYKIIPLALKAIYAPICFLPDGYLETMKKESPKKYHHLMHVERDEFVVECVQTFKDTGVIIMETVEELVEYCYETFRQQISLE